MRNPHTMRNLCRLVILCTALGTVAALPLLSKRASSTTSKNVGENQNGEIRYVYRTPVAVAVGALTNWAGMEFHLASRLPSVTFRATSSKSKSLARIRTAVFFRQSSPVAVTPPGQSPMTPQPTAGSKGTRSYQHLAIYYEHLRT